MADVHDQATRSRNMAAIRGADTRPEMILRKGLHARGFRFRLHDRRLAGVPDLVLPRFGAVIFVNGCFWHGHECEMFRWPATREEFWRAKIGATVIRDLANLGVLAAQGWRIATVWECALRGRQKLGADAVIQAIIGWLGSDEGRLDLRGGAA